MKEYKKQKQLNLIIIINLIAFWFRKREGEKLEMCFELKKPF